MKVIFFSSLAEIRTSYEEALKPLNKLVPSGSGSCQCLCAPFILVNLQDAHYLK